jgi:hypothetical protein
VKSHSKRPSDDGINVNQDDLTSYLVKTYVDAGRPAKRKPFDINNLRQSKKLSNFIYRFA